MLTWSGLARAGKGAAHRRSWGNDGDEGGVVVGWLETDGLAAEALGVSPMEEAAAAKAAAVGDEEERQKRRKRRLQQAWR